VTLMIFDVLYHDGEPVWRRPYHERRRLLDELTLDGPAWRTPLAFCAATEGLAAATRAHGLEGVIAKRRDAAYQPGPRRTGAWVKIKHRHAERDDRRELLDVPRDLQPRGLGRRDHVRELGITAEVHHHGRVDGPLRDPIVRHLERAPGPRRVVDQCRRCGGDGQGDTR
jgi:hypothetical protein